MANETQRPWVSPDEVAAVGFGLHIGEDEKSSIEGLINFAEQKIVARKALQVEKRLRDGSLDLDSVKNVVIDLVLRVVKNPEGLQSDGTGSVTTAYFRGAASGVIELLDEDIEALMPRTRRFGTMTVGVPGWRLP